MKTLHFASILVLASAVTFACGDDDDDETPIGTAGSSGAAGKNGTAGSSGAAGKNGTAGGSTQDAGAGGGGAGEAQGGAGTGGAGGAGAGGAGGEGGRAFVCPPLELGGAGGEFSGGGAGGEGGSQAAALEIIGKWSSPFSTELIRQDRWRSFGDGFDGTSAIVEYDNDKNVVYTESNCEFSKLVYLDVSGGSFYYCTVAYGFATLEAAKADTKVADPATPDASGCGSFPWSKLTKL